MIFIELNEDILLSNKIPLQAKGLYVLFHCIAQLNPDMDGYPYEFVQQHTLNGSEDIQTAYNELIIDRDNEEV